MSDAPFREFTKIFRLFRDVVVTEKIDGTNGQIFVNEDGGVRAGSRNRWLTVEADNFGFARWVQEHADELRTLGPGHHYGEWWGKGIQRGYGLDHKRFSLFNVSRWGDDSLWPLERPACCHVVPVLWRGPMDTTCIMRVASRLWLGGSAAAPGFMKPEGIVIFHEQADMLFKYTLEKNDGHKSAARLSLSPNAA